MEITDTTTPPPAPAEFLTELEMALSQELGYGAILSDFDEDDIDFVAETMTPHEAATWLLAEVDEPVDHLPGSSVREWLAAINYGASPTEGWD